MKPHDREEAGSQRVECDPNHTPGPLRRLGKVGQCEIRGFIAIGGDNLVATAYVATSAAADLYAAAPELLEALKTICGMHELSYRVPNGSVDPFDVARAAIAKATRAALSNPATEPDREAKDK